MRTGQDGSEVTLAAPMSLLSDMVGWAVEEGHRILATTADPQGFAISVDVDTDGAGGIFEQETAEAQRLLIEGLPEGWTAGPSALAPGGGRELVVSHRNGTHTLAVIYGTGEREAEVREAVRSADIVEFTRRLGDSPTMLRLTPGLRRVLASYRVEADEAPEQMLAALEGRLFIPRSAH